MSGCRPEGDSAPAERRGRRGRCAERRSLGEVAVAAGVAAQDSHSACNIAAASIFETPRGGTPRFGLSRRTNNIREDSDWPVQEEEQAHYDEEEFVVVSVVDDEDEEEEDDDEEEEDDDDDDDEEADESPASAFFARVDWATEAS